MSCIIDRKILRLTCDAISPAEGEARDGHWGHEMELGDLLENNRQWAETARREKPNFFAELCRQQSPAYLWIGCSDSRVPANTIVGLDPGELFVHRNVGNVVAPADLNCLSVIQYAVDVLNVDHIIVCGHYGCGAVHAAASNLELGLADSWIQHIKDVRENHCTDLAAIDNEAARADRLCELNVLDQVRNVCDTAIVRDAWRRGGELFVHGWVYRLSDGLLRDLDVSVGSHVELASRPTL
jgi:carbonic anhydrase